MFVGHYAASFIAKAEEPSAPLWSYFAAAQLLDIGWGALVIVGVEKMRVDPALPGSVFDLYYMPWTHSLLAAVALSSSDPDRFAFFGSIAGSAPERTSRRCLAISAASRITWVA